MRTYTRAQLDEARALWDEGEFSNEWREVRHLAAMRAGIIYPPTGSKWDSWDDAEPSQRAMLVRAIRETPKLLDRCITPRTKSWGDVLTNLTRARDDWRDRLRYAVPEPDEPSPRESTAVLAAILTRIADSVGLTPPGAGGTLEGRRERAFSPEGSDTKGWGRDPVQRDDRPTSRERSGGSASGRVRTRRYTERRTT